MENQGWVSLNRKLSSSELWLSEKFTRGQAWVDLLLLANHKGTTMFIRGNEVKIERGQLGWSEEALCKRWRWSRNKLRGYKEWLKRYNRIDYHTDRVLSVITILNYNDYQKKVQQNEQQTIQQKVQQKDNRKYTNNNDNNENNDNNSSQLVKSSKRPTLESITEEDVQEIAQRYVTTPAFVRSKLDDLINYCGSKNKHYANYKLALANWVKRDVISTHQSTDKRIVSV